VPSARTACDDENVKAVVASPANTMPTTAKLPIVLNLVMGPPMSGKFPGRVGPHRQSQADYNKCPTRFERRLVGVARLLRPGQSATAHSACQERGVVYPFGLPYFSQAGRRLNATRFLHPAPHEPTKRQSSALDAL
jgi:hypothetical protein